MSANVGYATLSVVPSLKGMQAALERDGGPAVKAFGKDAGDRIGTSLQRGMADKFGATKLPVDKLAKQGDKLGDEIGGRVRKGVEEHASRISFGKMAAGLGGILGGAGLLSLGQESFKAFSDLNESKSKAIVVFGDSFGVVDAQAQNAAKSLGISRQAALESAATFGNLFRAMGLSVDKSADMSTNLNQLASDLASFNNANPADVLTALKSGLVGETEPLRAFGVNLNEARINAEALRLGLVHGTVDMVDVQGKTLAVEKATKAAAQASREHGAGSLEARDAAAQQAKAEQDLQDALAGNVPQLDAAQKAQAAYSLILQDTTLAQGDFARTADGAANKGRIAAAQFEDLKATLGEKAAPFGNALLSGAIAGLDGLQAWWTTNGPGLQKWFHDTFGEDPAANFRTGLDQLSTKFHEIFGEDPVANFQRGADIVSGKLDEIFGQDKVANFQRGADIISEKFHSIFGEDPGANFRAGIDLIAEKVQWFDDHVIDPLFGTLQDLGADLDKRWTEFRTTVLDPVIGTFQSLVSLWNGLDFGIDISVPDWVPLIGGKRFVVDDIFPDVPGFDTGGVVPGPLGSPQLILAHAGETVLPTHKSPSLTAPGTPLAGGLVMGDIVINGVREEETAFTVRREMRRIAKGLNT